MGKAKLIDEGTTSPGGNGPMAQEGRPGAFTYYLSRLDPRCVSLLAPNSYESGRYLQLRSTLEQEQPNGRGVVVAITSPAEGEGKTLTAINLAGAFAQNPDLRVLLIDVDLRKRSEALGRYLGLSPQLRPGLTDILYDGKSGIDPELHIEGHLNLSILLSGKRNTDPYELLASRQFGEFIEDVRHSYHYVILDAPPIMPVPDNTAISDWIDGFLMVITANSTPRSVLAEAMRTIGPEKMIGLVLNQCEPLPERYHRYYGTYGYGGGESDVRHRRTDKQSDPRPKDATGGKDNWRRKKVQDLRASKRNRGDS